MRLQRQYLGEGQWIEDDVPWMMLRGKNNLCQAFTSHQYSAAINVNRLYLLIIDSDSSIELKIE